MGRTDIRPVRHLKINSEKTSLKELFQQMGGIFDIEVKEFSNYFMNIKNQHGWAPGKIHGFVERGRIGTNGRGRPETVAKVT
jgi:hypothetical protein